MKFSIKQNIFIEYLNHVIKGVSTKNLIPILNCIKLELTNDGLYLMSTDNEIAIKTFIESKDIEKIENIGSIVISGRYIFDIVRKMPNCIINIEEVVDSKVYIYTDNSSFNLNCNNVNEFPDLNLDVSKNPICLDKKIFKNIIAQTSFAASTQEARPVLTGINFKIEGNRLECVATDSYRLSKKLINLTNNNIEDVINIIIPTKNLNELIKLITDDEEKIEMHIFNNKVIFKFDNIIMMSTLINGSYPDTSKLIPEEYLLEINVKLNEFYNALDRASLLTNQDDKNTINLETFENKIKIHSTIPEIGNVEENIESTKNNSNNIKIAFSSKYMMDALKAFSSDNIILCFSGEIKPIIIKSLDNQDLTELILPIRTY